jgi:hypothetical protein
VLPSVIQSRGKSRKGDSRRSRVSRIQLSA